jgi:60 kDa SS-A/Ro ribonucleoprotein
LNIRSLIDVVKRLVTSHNGKNTISFVPVILQSVPESQEENMAKINLKKTIQPKYTHEGAKAKNISKSEELRRTVMACLLWEDTFYENGEAVADRIKSLVSELPGDFVSSLAIEAREKMKLRHVPLLLTRELARHPKKSEREYVSETLARVIQRPDELTEYIAIYWKDGKEPLSAQSKKGLAKAFLKFNEYSFAKYNRDGAVKLRDALFLSHAKPENFAQAELFAKITNGTLQTPDTWEVALSSGADKKETFTRLLKEEKLGALALLRNLRGMTEAGVSPEVIKTGLKKLDVSRVLPFRFISAAKYAPQFESEIEETMLKALSDTPELTGKTVLLIDNSGSMYGTPVSKKSEIDRSEAACALAILLREICEDVTVVAFSGEPHLVPSRHGFALRDAIRNTERGGTNTESAKLFADKSGYDRLIIVTDEQSHQSLSNPLPGTKAYVINVASYQNGVGYGKYNHIDGWSESVIEYIQAIEDFDAE